MQNDDNVTKGYREGKGEDKKRKKKIRKKRITDDAGRMNDHHNRHMMMPHSHSTPAGVDGGSRTPPATPRKAGKMLAFRIQMLDDSVTIFQVQV